MSDSNGANGHANGTNGTNLALGRPSGYHPDLCEKLIAWFDRPRTERVIKKQRTIKQRNGDIAEEIEWETVSTGLATFDGFAAHVDEPLTTLKQWSQKHPDFKAAWSRARAMQRDWLVELGTRSLILPGTYTFTMANISEWRAQPIERIGEDRKPVFFFDPMRASRGIGAPSGEQARVSG